MVITLLLLALLGAVFLRGFKEAIGVAVILVAIYLGFNVVVIAVAFGQVAAETVLWSKTGRPPSPNSMAARW